MSLSVDIEKTLGNFRVAARFETGPGITALFGRSGAGKTSIVRMLAGLTRPDAGRIALNGAAPSGAPGGPGGPGDTVLFDAASRTDLPPERRRIGYVFQDSRLFPHMTVRRNLDYGARRLARGAESRIAFDPVVEVLGIGHLLDRHPRDLSGGENQRVAIGRALLASPRLLLLDEPLASLDAERKWEIIPFIESIRDGFAIPMIYVSHSVDEILRLADGMVLLADGRVMASGPVEDVLNRPDLVRIAGDGDTGSVVPVTVGAIDNTYGITELAFAGGAFRVTASDLAPGERLRIRVRARDVSIALRRPEDISVLNVFAGRIAAVDLSAGPQVDVDVDVGGTTIRSRVTRKSCDDLGLVPGREVYALVKAVAIDRPSRP